MHNSGVYYLIILLLFMISINTYWSNPQRQFPLSPSSPPFQLSCFHALVFAFDYPAIAVRVVYRSVSILSTATSQKKIALPLQATINWLYIIKEGWGLIPSFASMTGCWEFILMQVITVVVNSRVQYSHTKKLAFPCCPSAFHSLFFLPLPQVMFPEA